MTTILSDEITWPLAPEFPSCQTIDILKYFNLKAAAPRQIFFQFRRVRNLGVYLYIKDRNKALKRPLKGRENQLLTYH